MANYVILRDRSRMSRARGMMGGFGALAAPGAMPGLESAAPPDPQVESADLSPSDVRDVQRDPTVAALARSMPIKLIEPEGEAADAASGGAQATWGVEAVGALNANETGADTLMCILDTGIDASHAAFAGMTLDQRDFTGSGNGDVQGHGTHCAGTIFGRDVDGMRIGVAPGVERALIGKVLGNDGSGSSDWLFDAMQWAMEQEAQVLSMSLGFDFPGFAKQLIDQGFPELLATSVALEGYRMNLRVFDGLMDLMRARAAFSGGCVVCAASGNESERQIDPQFEVSASLPSAAVGVVSVGALGESEDGLVVADFSNTNPILSAPGVNVVSAKTGGGLMALNGTSMATPHVAGLAALWWERARNGAFLPTSGGVAARLRAACRTDVFAPGVDLADRGDGLAQAPVPLGS
ncbi:MAG: S8 family serine peptidase [Pseudomonadota bacterium]